MTAPLSGKDFFWIDRRFVDPDNAVVKFYNSGAEVPIKREGERWDLSDERLPERLHAEVMRHLEDGDRQIAAWSP